VAAAVAVVVVAGGRVVAVVVVAAGDVVALAELLATRGHCPKNDFRPPPPTQLATVGGEGVVRARFVAAGGVLHFLVAEVGRLAELAALLRGVAVAPVRRKA
jgi:hypothetical protein